MFVFFVIAGLSDKQIDDLESQYKLRLPDDVRCVYKFHNGQRWDAVAGYDITILWWEKIIDFSNAYLMHT